MFPHSKIPNATLTNPYTLWRNHHGNMADTDVITFPQNRSIDSTMHLKYGAELITTIWQNGFHASIISPFIKSKKREINVNL
jgi:hypothetical protein